MLGRSPVVALTALVWSSLALSDVFKQTNREYLDTCGKTHVEIPDPRLDGKELAPEAKTVLNLFTKHQCTTCHRTDNSPKANRFNVLNVEELLRKKKLDVEKPEESLLYKMVDSGEMPQGGAPLTVDEKETILKWIAAKAPALKTAIKEPRKIAFISEADRLACIVRDLETLPKSQRGAYRYFSISHVYNAGTSDEDLQQHRRALTKLLNSLSWAPKLIKPLAVDGPQTLFRIKYTDFLWSGPQFEKITKANPFQIDFYTDAAMNRNAAQIMDDTSNRVPYLRGDWFVAAASQPPLYHDLLDLPDRAKVLEGHLSVNVEKNIESTFYEKAARAQRAGFNQSGVSRNNRIVERHAAVYGAYWKSYDFGASNGKKKITRNPLGPAGTYNGIHVFEHDGGEIIFNLPNGLQGYLLIDNVGKRIDKGPINVVSDKKRADRTVTNGVSCMGCHIKGMLPFDDIVAKTVRESDEFSREERDFVERLYGGKDTHGKTLKENAAADVDRYKKASEALGISIEREDEPVFAIAQRFEEAPLNLLAVAAEFGFTPEEFLKLVPTAANLTKEFAVLKNPDGTISRDDLTELFPKVVDGFTLGETNRRGRLEEIARKADEEEQARLARLAAAAYRPPQQPTYTPPRPTYVPPAPTYTPPARTPADEIKNRLDWWEKNYPQYVPKR